MLGKKLEVLTSPMRSPKIKTVFVAGDRDNSVDRNCLHADMPCKRSAVPLEIELARALNWFGA